MSALIELNRVTKLYGSVIGVNDITPAASAVGTGGSVHYAYFVAHNLGGGGHCFR